MIREELKDVVKKAYEQGHRDGFTYACDVIAPALTDATTKIVSKLKEKVKDIEVEVVDEHEEEEMKELKFRAWSNENNRYCDFVTLDESRRWIGWIMSSGTYLTTIDVNLEQYTGLKDKNNKEIYEGDIVEYDWYVISDKPAYRVKEQVVFDDMGARLGNDRIRNCSNVEIIGNIHENADLLGGK